MAYWMVNGKGRDSVEVAGCKFSRRRKGIYRWAMPADLSTSITYVDRFKKIEINFQPILSHGVG